MARFRSFAKINWHLEVVGRREDGFHELRTIFQTIDLHDELEVEIEPGRPGVRLRVEGAELPVDRRNLAVQAAQRYLEEWGEPRSGVRIDLKKGIPVGAGLGGGSSNGAAVLEALATLGRRPPRAWMEETARRLGSDVPFFLLGGLALGTGRGDHVRPLADSLFPARELWLALPGVGLATADVYASLSGPFVSVGGSPIAAAERGERLPEPASDDYRNDLESAAFRLSRPLAAVYTALERSGARLVRMSGSGSTLFACFDSPAAAAEAAVRLPAGTVWKRVRTMGREAWRLAAGFAPVAEGD